MTLGKFSAHAPTGFSPYIPLAFVSLEEARNSFDYHWNSCVRVLHDIGDPPSREKLVECQGDRDKYMAIFHAWEHAFETFLQNSVYTLDKNVRSGVRVLQMMQVHAFTSLDSYKYDVNDQTIFDNYVPFHQRQVELAEAIVEDNHNSCPVFCLEMNFVAPLYAVAHKCRDPIIRRRAVAVLASSPRQEGIWESIITSRVAQRLIDREEEGLEVTCCQDVPDWARLSATTVKFDYEGRLGTVHYIRTSDPKDGEKREDLVETITW